MDVDAQAMDVADGQQGLPDIGQAVGEIVLAGAMALLAADQHHALAGGIAEGLAAGERQQGRERREGEEGEDDLHAGLRDLPLPAPARCCGRPRVRPWNSRTCWVIAFSTGRRSIEEAP